MHIVGPVNSLSLQGTELQHGRVEAVGGMFQQKIPRDGFYLASDFGGGGEILNGQTWVRHPPLSTPLPPEIDLGTSCLCGRKGTAQGGGSRE